MTTDKDVIPRRSGLSVVQRLLLDKRLNQTSRNDSPRIEITKRKHGDKIPLSFGQRRIWFLDQLVPNTALYNLPVALRLKGRVNAAALQKSFTSIVARHCVLRSRFNFVDSAPMQTIADPEPVALDTIDLRGFPEKARETQAQELLNKAARTPFNLSKDLMLRCTLIRLSEHEHILLLVIHHIAADAWSIGVLFRELSSLYEAFNTGHLAILPDLPIQYADYALWQSEQLNTGQLQKETDYWKHQLNPIPEELDLPTCRPLTQKQSFRGGYESLALAKSLVENIKLLARQQNVTLYMFFLAALQVLLHRYSRQRIVLVGSPIAGRTLPETEGLIGFFVNTLVLRGDTSGNPSFVDFLQQAKEVGCGAFSNQELPFEKLIEQLRLERNSTRTPLIRVMFALVNASPQTLKLPGINVENIPLSNGMAKFDLTLSMEETPQGMTAVMEYSGDLFDAVTIKRMLRHFHSLLENIVETPLARISNLALMSGAEQKQVLVDWNDTQTNYPRDKVIAQLFEEQANKSPGSVALVFRGEHMTYRELEQKSNQLARYLVRRGVGPDVLVGVCMDRSFELIVALLAILKAGGAYVSLDPTYPKQQLDMMLEDISAPVLLTLEHNLAAIPETSARAELEIVPLDKAWAEVGREERTRFHQAISPDNLAYVSFTSGSTGRPKGVCVTHRGVVRLVKETNYMRFGGEIFLHLAPIAFDASTLEIWGALLNASRLVIAPPGVLSLSELGSLIQQNRVSTLWLTAGLFQQMVEEQLASLKGVRQLLAGGDVLSVPHVQKALSTLKRCQLINGYGPTENTTFTCCHRITDAPADGRSIPIGRPVSNTQVYVLDEHNQPVPIGVPGELFVGGDGLARGYLNSPELTTQRFIANRFGQKMGDRFYRTGDLVRWLEDGSLEFLGRADEQVKIRGFRVEPGEIAFVLGKHPAVRECAVITASSPIGEKRLMAYVVRQSGTQVGTEELREFLRQKLPEHMVPALIICLEALPLNANGKIDKRALTLLGKEAAYLERKYVAPRDATEAQLTRIWEETLNVQPIGINDHFFDLGGHSLLAVKLVAQIEKAFLNRLPVATVFESPTVELLASVIRKGGTVTSSSSVLEIQPQGSKPPLFFVHGVGGGMFWGYTNLSRYLGLDQPVYALKPRTVEGEDEADRIEEMASKYLEDIKLVQPIGPYRLGGYCFGGNVAYEMARQLEARGEHVADLVLFNSAPPNSSYSRVSWTPSSVWKFLKNFRFWLGYFSRWHPDQQRNFVRWKLRSLSKRLRRVIKPTAVKGQPLDVEEIVDLSAQPVGQRKLWERHICALMQHHPKPYGGNLVLFRTEGHQFLCSFDESYGWSDLVRGKITIKKLPGTHESILDEPYVQAVAYELKTHLTSNRNE